MDFAAEYSLAAAFPRYGALTLFCPSATCTNARMLINTGMPGPPARVAPAKQHIGTHLDSCPEPVSLLETDACLVYPSIRVLGNTLVGLFKPTRIKSETQQRYEILRCSNKHFQN